MTPYPFTGAEVLVSLGPEGKVHRKFGDSATPACRKMDHTRVVNMVTADVQLDYDLIRRRRPCQAPECFGDWTYNNRVMDHEDYDRLVEERATHPSYL